MIKPFFLIGALVCCTALAQADAPVARANWAVARAGDRVYTFFGLGPGKTHADIERDVHALDLRSGQWRKVGDIPVAQGRLASAALTVGGKVYLIGGYTVSPSGEEVSTPEVMRFLPDSGRFETETTMPVPVDDSVTMPWRERWIVLVSGWHDQANVADVQLYDTQTKQWLAATPYPGAPVFGHAGGLAGDTMVICDGVTAAKGADGKNAFAITNACWQGTLDPRQPARIGWRQLPAHPGTPLYRAGAVGDGGRIVFAGGSGRPYNYNGIGYDKLPAEPSDAVFSFNPQTQTWQRHAPLPQAGMDFRGLVPLGDGAYGLFGGMRAHQQVSGGVIRFTLPSPP
ncbi:N-acetylneuraminic acid mutarotase [Duganella sp. SG902]|uniref:Kelch repeat-containing protein n=1 Tax=Duganella sp. SG902 TaxID=2587016 RepID=UPI00159DBEC3|nr:galactose oxidase [Duganella sp. SG902]NVM78863.1 N-acetylneuraminic acid mutarotase [Duganella sp. SG902]